MTQPLRFGIIQLQNRPWATLAENCQIIESLGYDSFWVSDHFVNGHHLEEDWLDGWSVLTALAARTRTIRIGPLVSNIIYRHPAVLAKQALTVDHISQGRLNLGIGATTDHDPSHRMTGVEVWSTAERVQRFREVIEIVDLMLRNETTTYQGRYYTVTDALMKPAPIQKPRPPLTIAAVGRTTLKIAAKYADTWNTFAGWNLSPQQTLESLRERCDQLEQYCAQIGRAPNSIIRSFLVGITDDKPFASLDAFHDFIGRYRELGFSEFIFYYDYSAMPTDKGLNREMLERIATEAIPAIKSKSAGIINKDRK
jgi:alkanesulfonate monooxygenase SsuD/methylene tetrahydromethanopterin reductase-like flavin-dependent oxidoreductase (luciferase family)